jgi:DNA-binding NarL/FixJ family response regulator
MANSNKTILLIDDEEIIRTTLGYRIQAAGYKVLTAGDGMSGLEILKKNRIDLLVTDLMMEGLDGIQVLEQAKNMDARFPVIILTAYGDMTSAIKALRLGADDYLLKPCDLNEFLLRIARCLEKQDLWQQLKDKNVKLLEEISERKRVEAALAETNEQLEQRVRERTVDLEETMVALRVLLKKMGRDKRELEEKVVANVEELIEPLLDKLASSRLNNRQQKYVEAVAANLQEIISPFLQQVSTSVQRLTPTEIQVANLIRLGRTSKEIAGLLHMATGTVDVHRKNIRKKSGITNKKINLRTILDSQTVK